MKKIAATLLLLGMTALAHAVPTLVNYQGTLLDNNNIPVTQSNVPIVVSIWDHASSTATGNRKYQENHTVNVNDGNFSFPIGSGSSPIGTFNANLFNTSSTLYLQLNINGEDLLPRVRFLSAPYTLQSVNSGLLGNQPPTFYATASALNALQNQVNNLQIPSAESLCRATYGAVWINSQGLCVGGSVDLYEKDLSGENISGVRLDGAIFQKAKFSNALMKNSVMRNVKFAANTLLDFTNLTGSTLVAADLTGVDFSKTVLAGLYSDQITDCPQSLPDNWYCVQVSDAPKLYRLIGPTARFADDREVGPAEWHGTSFPTMLQGVNFKQNLFRNCSFPVSVKLNNANLFGASFATCSFSSSTVWGNTTCPDGTNSSDPANEGSCFNHGVPSPNK